MRSRRRTGAVLVPLVLLASAVLVAGCGGDAGTEVIGTTIAGAREVEVDATDFAFTPDAITVEAGEAVNLTLRIVEGGHNLVVVGTDFALPIADEGAVLATIVVDEPGDYELRCTVPGHAEEGMVGTLTVR